MTNDDVIKKLKDFHKMDSSYVGCDEYKSGNPEAKCTGIAVALVPTVEVIKKTAQLGCNLLITHEVLYYQTPDYPCWMGNFSNEIQTKKEALIKEHGIRIWRDHDHMHFDNPDSIFTGVIKYLGWENYCLRNDASMPLYYPFELPETTVEQFARILKEKIRLNGVRYIGRPDDKISKVALIPHIYPNAFMSDGIKEDGFYHSYDMEVMKKMEEGGIQAIIPGEVIEWTILSYIRDAIQLGQVRACFNIGHFNWEELGMKYAASYIKNLVSEQLDVHYIPSGDMWTFL